MMTLAVLSLAGSLFVSVATPTATYPHPAVGPSHPVAHLTRQWVADGRGQVWRPAPEPAQPQPKSTAQAPTARTFASVGK